MTSGASATISAAYLRELAASATPQRMSICILRPVVQPNDCKVCTNAATRACPSGSASCKYHQYPDTPHPLALLLRVRCNRPCCRPAWETDELAPPHVTPVTYRTGRNWWSGRAAPMSALDQKRTFAVQKCMSALKYITANTLEPV